MIADNIGEISTCKMEAFDAADGAFEVSKFRSDFLIAVHLLAFCTPH
jgi:hypothetical protein